MFNMDINIIYNENIEKQIEELNEKILLKIKDLILEFGESSLEELKEILNEDEREQFEKITSEYKKFKH